MTAGSTEMVGGPFVATRWPLTRNSVLGRPGLLLASVGSAVAEAVLLIAAAPRSSAAMAPQVSAVAPLGAFHDLRWLAVYHSSWVAFWGELLALVVFRSVLDTVMVSQAWPREIPRPRLASLLVRTLGFTALVVVILAPWTVVLFGLAVTPVSWLLITALPPVLAVAALTHHGVATGEWWRRLPSAASVAWVLGSFLALSIVGGLIGSAPPGAVVPLAALGGLWNALAWTGVVGAIARATHLRRAPLVPPLVALGLVGLVLGGAAAGFGAQSPSRQVAGGARTTAEGPPVLVVAGFGTHWAGTSAPPALGAFRTRWFSYRGMDGSGHPLSYRSSDTYQALSASEAKLAAQVESFHRQRGQPVKIVAVSEGTLVAKAYLASDQQAPVNQLVLVSPVADPGRVYYPRPGAVGWGTATGWALALLADGVGAVSPINISPSTPLFRSIVDQGPSLRKTLAQPLRKVTEAAILPLADAVATPDDINFGGQSVVVPAFHNGSLGDPAIRAIVTRLLQGRGVPTNSWSAAETVLHRGFAPWQVPTLDPSVNGAWLTAAA